jgi:transposase
MRRGGRIDPGDQFAPERGGLNTKLHAVTDATGRPLRFFMSAGQVFMSAGQVSDYIGAAALPGSLPAAEWLIADRGHDADWFRNALKDKGIKPVQGRFDPLDQI